MRVYSHLEFVTLKHSLPNIIMNNLSLQACSRNRCLPQNKNFQSGNVSSTLKISRFVLRKEQFQSMRKLNFKQMVQTSDVSFRKLAIIQ